MVELRGTVSGVHDDLTGKSGTIRNEAGEFYFNEEDLLHEEDLSIAAGDLVTFESDDLRHARQVCRLHCSCRARPYW